MTLVAGISIGGLPAFIGDLLISWQIPSKVDLPSVREPGIFSGSHKDYASGLAQKIIVVRPYLLIVWSGVYKEAQRIVLELDRVLPKTAFLDQQSLELYEVLDSCADGTEIVALFMDGDLIHPLCIRTRGFEIDQKRVYLLGTGASDFFNFLQDCPELLPSNERADGILARATMLRFAARAMAFQIVGTGLENSWGGGFEIAFPTPHGFKKIDRFLFRAWKLDSKGEYENSGQSFFSKYEGHDLFLSRFNPDEKTYVIKSLLKQQSLPKTQETIFPEWTLDLFILPTGQLVETARYTPFDRAPNDYMEFSYGKLDGWYWDKNYVDDIARRAVLFASENSVFKMYTY